MVQFDREELLLCECGDPAHQLIIYYDEDNEYPNVYVSVHLSPEKNFFKRLWRGLKYVLFPNKRSTYGDFDEIILRPTDAYKLQYVVDKLRQGNSEDSYVIFHSPDEIPS